MGSQQQAKILLALLLLSANMTHICLPSFNVICWNTSNPCHLVHTKLILASPWLWSIQSTIWFDWFFLWIWPNCLAVWVSTDIFTQKEISLHVNLLNEGILFFWDLPQIYWVISDKSYNHMPLLLSLFSKWEYEYIKLCKC